MKTIPSIPHQSEDGVVLELSTKEFCITEIVSLRRAIYGIQSNLKKFQGMKAYNTLSTFETKYIQDSLLACYQELNVQYVTE